MTMNHKVASSMGFFNTNSELANQNWSKIGWTLTIRINQSTNQTKPHSGLPRGDKSQSFPSKVIHLSRLKTVSPRSFLFFVWKGLSWEQNSTQIHSISVVKLPWTMSNKHLSSRVIFSYRHAHFLIRTSALSDFPTTGTALEIKLFTL